MAGKTSDLRDTYRTRNAMLCNAAQGEFGVEVGSAEDGFLFEGMYLSSFGSIASRLLTQSLQYACYLRAYVSFIVLSVNYLVSLIV